ncbi:hypothetical protein [Oceanobacillus profundus]|nr:hypothetical protein [Oceanobacillus profundus]
MFEVLTLRIFVTIQLDDRTLLATLYEKVLFKRIEYETLTETRKGLK